MQLQMVLQTTITKVSRYGTLGNYDQSALEESDAGSTYIVSEKSIVQRALIR